MLAQSFDGGEAEYFDLQALAEGRSCWRGGSYCVDKIYCGDCKTTIEGFTTIMD